MASSLPSLLCRRGVLPTELTADPASGEWQGKEAVELCDNLHGGSPVQKTRVRSAWDDASWHLLFEVEDTNPWATLTERDAALWTEQVVEVFLDPVGDLESYFEVEINPLGAVVDLVLRRTASGWRKNFAWRVEGLKSLVRRTPAGWTAELSIPFDAVAPMAPQAGTRWRANFLRIDRPAGPGSEANLSAWSPTGLRNFHRPECFGTVEFVG